MLKWRAKSVGETVHREINWAGELNGSAIISHDLSLADGSVSFTVDDIGPEIVKVTLAGGDAERNTFLDVITTDDGRTLQQVICIDVVEELSKSKPRLPGSSTKLQLINKAYEKCGLPEYTFDKTPEEISSMLLELDMLMGGWEDGGLDLNYNFPSASGGGDPDEASGIPRFAEAAVVAMLAEAFAPAIGKTLSAEFNVSKKNAMTALYARMAKIPKAKIPATFPRLGRPWL